MVTAADPMTPDASFTSPLFTIDEHRCGVTEEYTCDDSRRKSGKLKYIKQIGRRETEGISSRQGDLASRGPYRKQKRVYCRVEGPDATGIFTEQSAIDNAESSSSKKKNQKNKSKGIRREVGGSGFGE